ncbi:hypothetical protein [Paenibacillus cremeus]|uniref:Uncharacterized protein n=1 Tax=Paenibacillus cremeus TaxID=2163881 RepID=A0A559KCM0_9BACL|nr:hypothetical protein [Paenibacillus cremeus]TVY09870.1 hypothetical protein FPZ49_10890 [Paenibacillus cremeus]
MMKIKTYDVYFYFGVYVPNPFMKASKVVEVEIEENSTEKDIILKALGKIGAYPKTYAANVIERK